MPGGPTTVIAHEKVLDRMSAPFGKTPARPADAWPTDTFILDEKDLYFNNEAIFIYHDAAGHTDGDSMVLFRRSDVVVSGDVFVPDFAYDAARAERFAASELLAHVWLVPNPPYHPRGDFGIY